MNLWNLLFGEPDTNQPDSLSNPDLGINPASGLPMIEGASIDVAGNPYGTDSGIDSWE